MDSNEAISDTVNMSGSSDSTYYSSIKLLFILGTAPNQPA